MKTCNVSASNNSKYLAPLSRTTGAPSSWRGTYHGTKEKQERVLDQDVACVSLFAQYDGVV
jgi:hypothetical protein